MRRAREVQARVCPRQSPAASEGGEILGCPLDTRRRNSVADPVFSPAGPSWGRKWKIWTTDWRGWVIARSDASRIAGGSRKSAYRSQHAVARALGGGIRQAAALYDRGSIGLSTSRGLRLIGSAGCREGEQPSVPHCADRRGEMRRGRTIEAFEPVLIEERS